MDLRPRSLSRVKKIQSEEDYRERFGDHLADERNNFTRAFELAADTRKFEIGLYWQRAAYFWGLIAAVFGTDFYVRFSEHSLSSQLLECIGLLLSAAWYLVNRGSKYWQENWERHVDVLEDQVVGPLYRTTIARTDYGF